MNDPHRESQHAAGSRPQVRTAHSTENGGQPVSVGKSENGKTRLLLQVKLDGCGGTPLIPALGVGKAEGFRSCRQLAGLHSKLKQNKTKKKLSK